MRTPFGGRPASRPETQMNTLKPLESEGEDRHCVDPNPSNVVLGYRFQIEQGVKGTVTLILQAAI